MNKNKQKKGLEEIGIKYYDVFKKNKKLNFASEI